MGRAARALATADPGALRFRWGAIGVTSSYRSGAVRTRVADAAAGRAFFALGSSARALATAALATADPGALRFRLGAIGVVRRARGRRGLDARVVDLVDAHVVVVLLQAPPHAGFDRLLHPLVTRQTDVGALLAHVDSDRSSSTT